MAHRKVFLSNEEWDVWDVRPQSRMGAVGNGMENGWLCFQSGTRRRRLAPIPDGWHEMDERRLRDLFESAREVHQILNDSNEIVRSEGRSADQRSAFEARESRDRDQRRS
jgi:hypothetical protein